MEDRLLRLLNSNKTINEHIDDYKEAFIEFYGEDMRDLIEQQFSKCTFIGQLSPKYIGCILSSLYKEKGKQIVNDAVMESGLNFTYDDLVGNYSSLRDYKNNPINLFHQFYEEQKLGEAGRKKTYLQSRYNELLEVNPDMSYNDFLVNHPFIVNDERYNEKYYTLYSRVSPLLRKISPDLDVDNIDEVMGREIYQKLDNLFYLIDSRIDSFHQFEESLIPYEKLHDSLNKLASLKSNNCILDLARETYHLFPEQINHNLEGTLDGTINSYSREELFNFIYGRNIEYPSEFDCFSEESDQALALNKDSWKVENIQKKRIKYFNLLGIDLGNDYNKYLEDERVRSLYPTKEVCDEFFKARNKYLNKYNNDYFNSIPSNIDIREKINSLDLLVKDDAFDASSYNYAAFINPNVRMTDNGIDMHTILIVNCSEFNTSLDHYVTHELNHLIELSLEGETSDKYNFLCGWDVVDVDKTAKDENVEVDSLSKREEKRKYELFNEIINEKLAQEVSTIMHQHGKHIFNEKNNSTIKNSSSYEHYAFIVNEFYDKYKKDIIKSRHNGNIGVIYDAVGYDNFNQLNNLCNEFSETFPGMEFYQLGDDLMHKRSTDKTDKYFELRRKKDAIMMSIDSYRQDKGIKTLEEQASK